MKKKEKQLTEKQLLELKIELKEREQNKIKDISSMKPEKRYKLTKFFGTPIIRDFKRNEELEFISMLNSKKSQFIGLSEKLNIEEKTKLSLRWIQHLKKTKKFQSEDYHIFVIDKLIEEIKEDTLELNLFYNKTKLTKEQEKYFNTPKELKLFEEFSAQIPAKEQLIGYSFIFTTMHIHKLIKEDVTPTKFRDWVNQNYLNVNIGSYLKTYDDSYSEQRNIIFELLCEKFKIKLS